MELEVHWTGDGPMPVGRLYQDSWGIVFFEYAESWRVEAARETLRGESGQVLAELLRSGMSPGGAQPKALLAISQDFSEIRLDDPAAAGFGS